MKKNSNIILISFIEKKRKRQKKKRDQTWKECDKWNDN